MPKVVQSNLSLSPLQRHLQKWKDCTACPLCEVRTKVVLCKGSIPCDILFVGEAPGASEDRHGIPFHGPAGHLLDSIISRAFEGKSIKLAFSNIVACIPKEEVGKGKYGEPNQESIKACSGRLIELINLCKPKAIICVGELAMKWIPSQSQLHGEGNWMPLVKYGNSMQNKLIEYEKIVHPAAILKADITKQELMARRAVVSLEEVARRLGL